MVKNMFSTFRLRVQSIKFNISLFLYKFLSMLLHTISCKLVMNFVDFKLELLYECEIRYIKFYF